MHERAVARWEEGLAEGWEPGQVGVSGKRNRNREQLPDAAVVFDGNRYDSFVRE